MNSLSIGRFAQLGYATGEALNTLCTNLSFTGENIKKIMITSGHAAEGKTYISMNIMRTMANLGKTVVLVDADLRRSMMVSKYRIQFADPERKYGLAHCLAGKADLDNVIYQTNIPRAYMVPVGRTLSNPLTLLNSERFGQMLDALAQNVDYVIVDAPPVGLVIDGAQIAKSCDGALIVVSYNAVHRQELIDVKEQIEQTGCSILGTVLNKVEYDSYLNRKYNYKSYYSNYKQTGSAAQTDLRSGKKERGK